MNQYSHFNFKNDLTNGGTVRVTLVVPRDVPPDYLKQEYRRLQERFAVGLYDAIQHCRHPVVVELIEEDVEHIYDTDIITLDARLTPVEHSNIVMPRLMMLNEPVTTSINKSNPNFYRVRYYKALDKVLDFFGAR